MMRREEMMYRDGLLSGQRILVTGGGSGLGRVMAEGFLILGAEVFICGRRGEVLEAAAADLMQAHGGRAVPIVCDIRDSDAITRMLDGIWADGGPLTGLVNNAAGNFISRTEDLSMRGFDAVASIVFRGSFNLTLECGKRWLADGVEGSILSILATWVDNGCAFAVPSAMSKAAIDVMTKSLAVEWGGRGVRLNAIAPGTFPTEGMTARLMPKGQRDQAGRAPDCPMDRVGDMAELANLAAYLMAPGAAYVNGQTLTIDGGRRLAMGGNFSHLRVWGDDDWRAARESIRAVDARDRAGRSQEAAAE